jgi:hypothetical protein
VNSAISALLVISVALSACDGNKTGSAAHGSVAGPVALQAPFPPTEAAGDCSLVLYGDSILNGTYVLAEHAMRHPRNPVAELKAQRPAWQIDDRTQPGQSLAKLAKGFANDPRSSRVVVIGSGIAEGWSGGSVMSNLPWMLDAVRYEGRTPVLTGYARQVPNSFITPDKMAGRDHVDTEAKALARESDVEFADLGAAGPVEIVDDVHPTQTYSLRLTGQLIEALDRVAPECSH